MSGTERQAAGAALCGWVCAAAARRARGDGARDRASVYTKENNRVCLVAGCCAHVFFFFFFFELIFVGFIGFFG
jgi:hypothetical protein